MKYFVIQNLGSESKPYYMGKKEGEDYIWSISIHGAFEFESRESAEIMARQMSLENKIVAILEIYK